MDTLKLFPFEMDDYVRWMTEDEQRRLAESIGSGMLYEISAYRLAVLRAHKERESRSEADEQVEEAMRKAVRR
ncbi:MAG: hypothetical protein IJR13_07735 [Bacteroidales bacterium]|nr:hypothetical protein [Bacteroidales bacterium]